MIEDIVNAFLDATSALFAGIGDGVVTVFNTVIYDPVTETLTPLATWMLVFMGISFALTVFYGLFRKVA
jgi:hypothetical protein